MLSTVKIADPGRLADTVAAHLPIGVDEKQGFLETVSPTQRLEDVAKQLESEVEKLRVDKKIHGRVKNQMEKAQKEYYLNEKMKAIQHELGRKDERVNEIEEFRQKIDAAKMPAEARERPSRSSSASRSCPRSRPRPPSRATTSSGCWRCRGTRSRGS